MRRIATALVLTRSAESQKSTLRRYTLLSFRRGPRLRLAVLIVLIFATSARYTGASTPWPFQPLPWPLIVCRLSGHARTSRIFRSGTIRPLQAKRHTGWRRFSSALRTCFGVKTVPMTIMSKPAADLVIDSDLVRALSRARFRIWRICRSSRLGE